MIRLPTSMLPLNPMLSHRGRDIDGPAAEWQRHHHAGPEVVVQGDLTLAWGLGKHKVRGSRVLRKPPFQDRSQSSGHHCPHGVSITASSVSHPALNPKP